MKHKKGKLYISGVVPSVLLRGIPRATRSRAPICWCCDVSSVCRIQTTRGPLIYRLTEVIWNQGHEKQRINAYLAHREHDEFQIHPAVIVLNNVPGLTTLLYLLCDDLVSSSSTLPDYPRYGDRTQPMGPRFVQDHFEVNFVVLGMHLVANIDCGRLSAIAVSDNLSISLDIIINVFSNRCRLCSMFQKYKWLTEVHSLTPPPKSNLLPLHVPV